MLPLWDMLLKAQNGHLPDIMAKQFALTQAQVQAAVDALLPAFSQALKLKASTDPYGMTAFLTAMSSGNYAKYFEDAARAFSPEGTAAGETVLSQLFGSKDLSRAVAEHAARATGIGQEIMKQMLPALAAMMTGGIFKQFTDAFGQPGAVPLQTAMPPAADAFSQAWSANPWAKAFADAWKTPGQAPSAAENPFASMWQQSLSAAQSSPSPASQPTENPYTKLFGQMFETGRHTQEEYRRATEALFLQMAKGGAK